MTQRLDLSEENQKLKEIIFNDFARGNLLQREVFSMIRYHLNDLNLFFYDNYLDGQSEFSDKFNISILNTLFSRTPISHQEEWKKVKVKCVGKKKDKIEKSLCDFIEWIEKQPYTERNSGGLVNELNKMKERGTLM